MANRKNYHLRDDLESTRYQVTRMPKKFRQIAKSKVLPLLRLTGYKLDEQREIALTCIHNLVLNGKVFTTVADTRDTSKADVRKRIKVWDAIIDAGFAILCVGSEMSGKDTRYYATNKLLKMFKGLAAVDLVESHLKS